jgi:hypothetical protein
MRRALLFLLALGIAALSSVPQAQSAPVAPKPEAQAGRPQQADGIVRLLADVEAALVSGRLENFRPLAAAALPTPGLAIFERAVAGGGVSSAAVRERARRPIAPDGPVEVLADVFVGHGRAGRLATWLMTVRPRPGAPDRYELDSLAEPASFGNLVRLALDTTRQFAVHNLVLQAPDLTLKMASGAAFVAEDEDGITALVLLGSGSVSFDPRDTAEQGQLTAFWGRPSFDTAFDTAFVRFDSAEFSSRVADHALTPVAVDPRAVPRARAVFDDLSKKTYTVDLRDLAPGQWSLAPSSGSVVIEFRTKRFGWLTYIRSPGEAEDVNFFDRAHGHNLSVYASTETLAARGSSYSEDDRAEYDVEQYALDLSFDPRNSWIAGRASLGLRIRAAATNIVTLRLADSLTVSSVSSPAFGRLLTMRPVGQNSVIVNLPASVERDARVRLEVVYSGRLNPEPVDRESPAAQAPIASGDTRQNQGEAGFMVTPEPRYLYSNQHYWYPQSQASDYATATTRFQVPSEYQVVANGSLVRSSVAPATGAPGEARSTRTVEYVVDQPTRYLSCLITRLVEIGHVKVSVPALAGSAVEAAGAPKAEPFVNLEVVSTPRVANADRRLPGRVAEMIRLFAGLVGEAPYSNFTVAGVEDNLPGGHSPAGFAIWLQPLSSTPYTWSSDPLSLDMRYPQFFLAHEVAHQWWGQGVAWKNYHEQWLSEGFAQYFAAVFAGADRGPEMLHDLIAQMRDSAAQYSARGPVSLGYRLGHVQGNSRIFRAVLYNKSAVVLHMLRRLIGDDAFFAGLRRYYRDWRFAKAGTDDLRAAFEAETPLKLSRFFERWIRETTLPRLRVTSRVDAAGRSAVVRIEQVGEVFDLPFTVTVQYADGSSEAVTLPVTEAITTRAIALKGPVRRIVTRDELTLAEYVK